MQMELNTLHLLSVTSQAKRLDRMDSVRWFRNVEMARGAAQQHTQFDDAGGFFTWFHGAISRTVRTMAIGAVGYVQIHRCIDGTEHLPPM